MENPTTMLNYHKTLKIWDSIRSPDEETGTGENQTLPLVPLPGEILG